MISFRREPGTLLKRISYLWPYLRPHRRKLILGILAIAAGVLLGLVNPLLVGWAIDAVRRHVSGRALLGYAGLVVGCALVQGFFTYLQRMVLVAMSRDVEFDLRNVYFGRSRSSRRPSSSNIPRAT